MAKKTTAPTTDQTPANSVTTEPATPNTTEGIVPAAAVDPAPTMSAGADEPTHECTVLSPLRHNGVLYKVEHLVMLFEHEYERLKKAGVVALNKILVQAAE